MKTEAFFLLLGRGNMPVILARKRGNIREDRDHPLAAVARALAGAALWRKQEKRELRKDSSLRADIKKRGCLVFEIASLFW